ncbi:helix-turn-helix domain-containing protein [Pseudoduganella sp. UC29_106]|uniref:helix-turn-helix domain-containing protein n=1 Tax=Pseudoduganella sp. UC29_106 TaxID=3374553 RepID=UPI003756F62C
MPSRQFGLAVRRLREERGWSQERLAEAADMNRSYIGELERGIAMPSLQTIHKLAGALATTPSRLLERCEEIAA